MLKSYEEAIPLFSLFFSESATKKWSASCQTCDSGDLEIVISKSLGFVIELRTVVTNHLWGKTAAAGCRQDEKLSGRNQTQNSFRSYPFRLWTQNTLPHKDGQNGNLFNRLRPGIKFVFSQDISRTPLFCSSLTFLIYSLHSNTVFKKCPATLLWRCLIISDFSSTKFLSEISIFFIF
jgi:hypothetical protein